ncbi:UDP-glucose dehydrogenase family protein [Paenilisteria rocourtiae]|uniref:UDP-glucose 6-dehydrogenase n=1 Tax=Listeria rocourtiae TaxID=647910 RepID=A0A4R6ZQ71_9LIST|nr:UDP-glucose/GDP-mannose dehydrogenase family protein [Listeria rocourtiae]EUJ48380.1 nucleotide sugar dehydrogenase [Listeria rocourtiae FSL F6-920]MBC1605872.1 UDP-glucose/GDP-mannose dehydrogenase family protein [Listeria rocourtiae]TDR54753.1 UDPglucose 6-dehydrogenase [Listeria rocourtiae]
MKIAVAGVGYVGLVSAVGFAHHGHMVTAVDVDAMKIAGLTAGISPIFEPGLEALLQEQLAAGRIQFTTDSASAYADAEAIVIGVGTPENEDGSANLAAVYQVAHEIGASMQQDGLVIVKSTVPVGTNDKIEAIVRGALRSAVDVDIVSNPEFLAQGSAVYDTLHGSRIVVGTESATAEAKMRDIYAAYGQPIVSVSRKSAELIKYASNDFLALKISFVNEIANLCDILGADIEEVTEGMGYDPRIGNSFLRAGIGYGGSCFPKDTKALHWLAEDHGFLLRTIEATIKINEKQKYLLLHKLRQEMPTIAGKKIAVLGLTFKPNTDDLREAPSIPNMKVLQKEGAIIQAYDPIAMAQTAEKLGDASIMKDSIEAALEGADVCLIFTEWDEIRAISPDTFKKWMANPIVLDGRNCFNKYEMEAAGIAYQSVGRPLAKVRQLQ